MVRSVPRRPNAGVTTCTAAVRMGAAWGGASTAAGSWVEVLVAGKTGWVPGSHQLLDFKGSEPLKRVED